MLLQEPRHCGLVPQLRSNRRSQSLSGDARLTAFIIHYFLFLGSFFALQKKN
jgi:hypothetical protein